MRIDDILRATQRKNEREAIDNYEQRIADLYARRQDPNPRRWMRQDSSR